MTPSKNCEACGAAFSKPTRKTTAEWEKRRFCSKACSMRTVRQSGQAQRTHCRSGRHELVDGNVRIDGGRRACKACATEKERERKARLRGRPVVPRGPRRTTAAPAIPVMPAEQQVWRPAGFSAQPNLGRPS